MSAENPKFVNRTYDVDNLAERLSRLTSTTLPEQEITESCAVISEVDSSFLMKNGLWFLPSEIDTILLEFYTQKQIPFVKKDLAYYLHEIASYKLALGGGLVPDLLYEQKHKMWQQTLARFVGFANEILMGDAQYPAEPIVQDVRVFSGTDAERDEIVDELKNNIAVLAALEKHESDGSVN